MSATAEDKDAIIAALRAENAALRERQAARDVAFDERAAHQAATIDVLKAMSASPGDPQPVFDLIVQQVVTLLDTQSSMLFEYDGALLHFRADAGTADLLGRDVMDEFLRDYPLAPHRGIVSGRAILDAAVVHVRDLTADPDRSEAMRALPYRSQISVPLLRDGRPIGVLTSASPRVDSFNQAQVELLKTFAEQAVIAITSAETYRALQTRTAELAERNTAFAERIDHQSATIDVLKAMSASAGDARPALETIAQRARALCGALGAVVYSVDGPMMDQIVYHRPDLPAEQLHELRGRFPRPIAGATMAPAITERRILHIRDMDSWPGASEGARRFAKSAIWVPLLRDDTVIGLIGIDNLETGGFSDSQIELLKTFAEQATIAITGAETWRALRARTTDLQESLEYQTATSDVLKVISRSTFDLRPTLETVLETACRLCEADFAIMTSIEGEQFRGVATCAAPEAYRAITLNSDHFPLTRGSLTGRVAAEKRVVEIADVLADPEYTLSDVLKTDPGRTVLGVPLFRDGVVAGSINLSRSRVQPFTQGQITLVSTFADQAVIAIENTRLLTEQREALERQTAMAEVLQVINANPGDVQLVFDAILERSHRICKASVGALGLFDGKRFRALSAVGYPPGTEALLRGGFDPNPLHDPLSRGECVHVPDRERHEWTPKLESNLFFLREAGLNTLLMVPLFKDGTLLGFISAARREIAPFSEREIALLRSFAAQAVIAMENARLLTELREALEQQTATADVLRVINENPGELAPVFDIILEKSLHLGEAAFGTLFVHRDDHMHAVASRGLPPALAAFRETLAPQRVSTHPTSVRTMATRRAFQHADVRDGEGYRAGMPGPRAVADLGGARSMVIVPLFKDQAYLGSIQIYRQEVRAFSDKQVALLENFAAQAVIAMENARLLTEQREALEQQTATADLLQVINSSPGDLAPVFAAILDKAHALCGTTVGSLFTFDGQIQRAVATHGLPEEYAALLRRGVPINDTARRITADGTRPGQILDIRAIQEPVSEHSHFLFEQTDVRTILFVPLRKESDFLGYISAMRPEVRAFSDKEIALLENFAAQAVIAMENARLLTELREALEQQTATADVLRAITANPGDLAPVFETILDKAHALCGATIGSVLEYDGSTARALATHGFPDDFAEMVNKGYAPIPIMRRLIDGERMWHVADVTETPPSGTTPTREGRTLRDIGVRTGLLLPLRGETAVVGFISAWRTEVRPFSDKEIALLENFAAQAVIAMENARLLTETREALEQQTATAEVLRVINANPGDLAPVFDAILEKAHVLCGADLGSLMTFDGQHAITAATHNYPDALTELSRRPFPPTLGMRALLDGARLVHTPDARTFDPSVSDDQVGQTFMKVSGVRTYLLLPLRRDDALVGFLSAHRREVRPYTNNEIALLESFAAQAVIAMENARLLGEIRQRQEELHVTFENMGDGVAMFDETPRLVAWNSKFQEFFNVPDGLLAEHRTYAEYIRYLAERGDYGADADVEETVRRIAAMTGVQRTYERVRPDGRVIEIRNNPASGGGFVLMFSDVTERKRNEAAIAAARDAAETALRELKTAQANLIQAEKMASLGQLTAGIAHEIKNPLNFVNNFASLSVDLLAELKEAAEPGFAALTEDQRAEIDDVSAMLTSNLRKITEHGKRADGIVKAMLEHSRGASGERREVDVNALGDEALNLAYHGARAQDQSFNITLERDFGDGIAPIEMNPQDITRVFLNLFGNGFYAASKRARNGSVPDFSPTLKLTTRDLGRAVEIRVRDNGTGIPEDIRDKLFQPFFTTKPTGEGTGLGLSITYDIVTKQHGGTIAVDSAVDTFTEFVVTLPRAMTAGEGGRA